MSQGIKLIAREFYRRIDDDDDQAFNLRDNSNGQLITAAQELLTDFPNVMRFPKNWFPQTIHNMAKANRKQRLIIAGALIAAELDRLQREEESSIEDDDIIT